MEKQKNFKKPINIEELIGKVYFKIATWHNSAHERDGEENKTALYGTSFEIIKTVMESLNLSIKEEVEKGAVPSEITKKQAQEDDKYKALEKKLEEIAKKMESLDTDKDDK